MLGVVTESSSQTTITAGLVYGTWAITGSPYNVLGDIQIPNDSTLFIQPGVAVNFQGMYHMQVQGRLLAVGTATDTITFIASDTSNGWRGIHFGGTSITNDTSKLIFCKLTYGKATGVYPFYNGGVLHLDGFSNVILSNCRLSNNYCDNNGGAIYLNSSSPRIMNNTITNNTADSDGAGIFCFNSDPYIYNNLITYNYSISGNGGGVLAGAGSPEILNNNLIGNIAFDGGGIYNQGGSPIIKGNSILSNISMNGGRGGGIRLKSTALVDSNTISNNSANFGGGIESYNDLSVITRNVISQNIATRAGAGINCSASNPDINHNFISNNTALSTTDGGGGISCGASSPIISNNTITNNATGYNGGGISCNGSNPSISSNTISNNDAVNGGGLNCDLNSNPSLFNNILFGNTASTNGNQVFLNDQASDPSFSYCDLEGGLAGFGLNGNTYIGNYSNNLNSNPFFISPSAGSGTGFNGLAANWSLSNNSPCINTGDPSGVYPSTDLAGNTRVVNTIIDIGAYEYQGFTTINTWEEGNAIIYPIPTNRIITIELLESVNVNCQIFDSNGILCLSQKLNDSSEIDLLNLSKGVYVINLSTDRWTITKKLVLVK